MPFVLLAIALGTWAGFLASFKRFKEVRFYLFAWIFGAASAGVMNLRHFTNMDINQNMELDSIRISIVVDAIMMGLGVADRYSQDIKKRRASEQQALLQAKQNLTLNTRLFDLEEQYKLVTELAATRDQTLKNTVHDLREPLHALRLNVQNLREGGDFTKLDDGDVNFEETFSYLETLIADSLQSSVIEKDVATDIQVSPGSELSLPAILKSIHQMFLPDAEQKGLRFRYVETSVQSSVDPLVLMRIVTNLVSNAIKYTPSGTILLGVRRTSEGGARVEVHDTGPGMTDDEFSMAQLRSVRLGDENLDVSGYGYGLNIVSQLAKKHDLNLSKLEGRKTGASIAFDIWPNL